MGGWRRESGASQPAQSILFRSITWESCLPDGGKNAMKWHSRSPARQIRLQGKSGGIFPSTGSLPEAILPSFNIAPTFK